MGHPWIWLALGNRAHRGGPRSCCGPLSRTHSALWCREARASAPGLHGRSCPRGLGVLSAALGFASFPGVQKEGGRAKGALDLCSNVVQVVEGTQVGVRQAWAVPAVRGLGPRLLSLGIGFRTCTGGPWTPAPGAAVGMTGGW